MFTLYRYYITDEKGRWVLIAELPEAPESGNWTRPSAKASIYNDPFVHPSKRVGWSQVLEESNSYHHDKGLTHVNIRRKSKSWTGMITRYPIRRLAT
jgi:hypothetical protein